MTARRRAKSPSMTPETAPPDPSAESPIVCVHDLDAGCILLDHRSARATGPAAVNDSPRAHGDADS
jgi:hypothetical protein